MAGNHEDSNVPRTPITGQNPGDVYVEVSHVGKIQIVDTNDRSPILKIINSVSPDKYIVDSYGYLIQDSNKKNILFNWSQEFSNRIKEGIRSNKPLYLAIDKNIPAYDFNNGILRYPEVKGGGGGITSYLRDSGLLFCYINGENSPDKVKMKDGTEQYYTPKDILIHEIIGHAIPRMLEINGNAVVNENIVRKEMKWKERADEISHTCFDFF
ncbi:hypothetical protein AGMMS49579_25450 [Spirochaetia bacterium]|nr:hypothetical protein AGMMS49579_25450 [Spirochaetia bacterium]